MPPLTDTAIKAAKPRAKAYRLSDQKGLYLEVADSGGKWWRFKYRVGGKEKRLSLGVYPDSGVDRTLGLVGGLEGQLQRHGSDFSRSGANARHRANRELKEVVKRKFAERQWKSAHSASHELAPWVIDEAKRRNIRLSPTRAQVTVYEWLKEKKE
ncbi:Arm DNA-binding domain-containing protein [Panacagrimonas perspica]|uniref:Arm DNA-binding domain-containing protein n=1 Tax=Panacagrimonas perspica TaxID=381431 RepID=UPI00105D7622|nr:Arm DNA-binding domain-containing protein [Panacagrimonas perspica]